MGEVKHTPGPWEVGYHGISIVAPNEKCGGKAKLFDVRGWGYLTGHGHGGLGLGEEEAVAIQSANARLVASAPDMLAALKAWIAANDGVEDYSLGDEEAEARKLARAALAKAEASPNA